MQQTYNKNKEQKQKDNSNQQNKNNKNKTVIIDADAWKILQEVERLITLNDTVQAINLLRALKDNLQAVKNIHIIIITAVNLAILLYQLGMLEQSQIQFQLAIIKLKQASQKIIALRSKDYLRLRYETMIGRIFLQLCILFSQLGKHDLALQHARYSSKTSYNLIFDLQAQLCSNLNKLLQSKSYHKKQGEQINLAETTNIINNISILNHLINNTKDLKLAFLQKQRVTILEQQMNNSKKYGNLTTKINLQLLYDIKDNPQLNWIYRSKILDQIQILPYDYNQLQDSQQQISNNDVVQKITFLAISLYCFSTQTRFLQKMKQSTHQVLDSQHWLSRSLEIAYSFLPMQAPILNQIITVHDKFHGLEKQTIPQDEEVAGFFKVLRPLSKPKIAAYAKNSPCSPIMIRIQADKLNIESQGLNLKILPTNTDKPNSLNHNNDNQLFTKQKWKKNQQQKNQQPKLEKNHFGHRRVQTTDVNSARVRGVSENSLVTGNIRSHFVSRKFSHKKQQRAKSNLAQLRGKAVISQDLLSRPHSYQNRTIQHQNLLQKKKKPFYNKFQKKPNSLGTSIKFNGLQLKGHTIDASQLVERVQSQSGGNVYINNNINVYISKKDQQSLFTQTFVRGQVSEKQKHNDLSRRQAFLNKRRANAFLPQDL